MAARPSDTVFILKKDIENGYIKIKTQDDFMEYWIYTGPKQAYMDTNGILVEKITEGEEKLNLVVVCENDPKHIMKDAPNHYVVSGVRFDGDELVDYLSKTGRTL